MYWHMNARFNKIAENFNIDVESVLDIFEAVELNYEKLIIKLMEGNIQSAKEEEMEIN